MINQQSSIFPKQIKIDDYQPATQQNVIRIMQTSNLLIGNGGRSSNSSIILAKCLHMLHDDRIINLQGKNILEIGSGVGLLGIYLSCIGANVIMTDLPQMKDMIERNINLNRQILKGQTLFVVLNWKKQKNYDQKTQIQQRKLTSSSDLCYLKAFDKIDLTIICQGGSIQDVKLQIKWIGKQGMILCFLQRQSFMMNQFLNSHQLEQFLLQGNYEYQRIQSYHPDYIDERVCIYKIWV